VLERARQVGIRAEHWSETLLARAGIVEGLWSTLRAKVELIVLAGYMKLLPEEVVREYQPRTEYPSGVAPQFGGQGMYGMFVHEAVIAAKESQSGATIHFVDAEYDRGTIFLQRSVPVLPNDTPESLRERVLKLEHELLPEAIAKFAAERRVLS
jgi:phosphoribosylglycinamide formyltransferase-1